jgi:hypothetical protein
MLEIKRISNKIQFSGATRTASISDKQEGPTCGFEAIENIIELCRPEYSGRDLVREDLLKRAHVYKAIDEEGGLRVEAYQAILYDYGILSYWYAFHHYGVVLPALLNNRGVLVIGDAYYLNPRSYRRRGSGHAFVLTNFYTEESGNYVLGYTLRIDTV